MSRAAIAQALQSEVKYSARDSMRYDLAEQTVYLFGAATVKYQDVELTADRILLDLDREEVQAFGTLDSTGAPVGAPQFNQGGQEVKADSIRYNFKTKEGLIEEVRTQESQMYALAHLSKRHENGRSTAWVAALPLASSPPHYRFDVSKMIVIPHDKIVMGPAIMKIGNVPTPLVAPFGFFPNHKGGSAGLLIPTWGNSDQFGFFLLNGGYYPPRREFRSADGRYIQPGQLGTSIITRYKSRCRFSGNMDLQYSDKLNSIREYPDFSEQRTYFIRWNHLMVTTGQPYGPLQCQREHRLQPEFHQQFQQHHGGLFEQYLQSNVNWSHLWPGKPYSLSVAARHSQNTLTRSFDVTLPSVNFNVQRFFPGLLFRPESTGKQKWYERVGSLGTRSSKIA